MRAGAAGHLRSAEMRMIMKNGIVVTKMDGNIFSICMENGKPVQIQAEEDTSGPLLGNIYLGKVQNIVKNIGAAFVEIEAGQVCYLPLDERMPPVGVKGMAAKGNKVCIGDEILVQVAAEHIKTKPPTLTGNLSLTGKYLVLTRGKTQISLSSKIMDGNARKELKDRISAYKNDVYGFIIRTNAEHAPIAKVEEEAERLMAEYEAVTTYGIHKNRFSLIYQAPRGYAAQLRDGYAEAVEGIVTDDADIYNNMKAYLEAYQPEDLAKLALYQDENVSLAALYNLSSCLKNALSKNVWLKSGAGIVIEPTESLTAIDVNTKKAVKGRKNAEETFFRINCEAAVEIARQLRLRNLSGIILVDFIDMKEEEKREALLECLRREVKKDPVKTMVVDFTALGLVELTRKRIRKPLHESLKKMHTSFL